MHRAIPVANKVCAERVQQRNQDAHKQRLKSMRPQIDTTEPPVMQLDHLRNNLKREQLLEERYYDIDRENRILLQKMSEIMKHPGLSLDRGRSGPPSLNRDHRKNELMRITQENQNILKRIQKAQPIYNHVEWEHAYRRSEVYLRNKTEFPLLLRQKTPPSRANSLTPLTPGAKSCTAGSGFATGGMEDDGKGRLGSPDGGNRPAQGAEELRYVLKEGKKIGQRYYLVEMATDGRTLAISAYDGDSQRTLELLVNEKNHRRLYRDCNGDYNLIAGKLRVDGEQLFLDSGTGDGSGSGMAATV